MKRLLLLIPALLVALPYGWPPIYRFPEPVPFSGAQFFNPYDHLAGKWQRANFHAHGRAWGGVTNGEQTSAEVAQTYRAIGYDVAGVSNYHQIAAHDGVDTLPIYEHGYNINKRHQLAIGARRVAWFDLPLWQSLSQQQFIIDRVRSSAELVALSHPLTRDAYDPGSMRRLTGYQLMEVINGGHTSESSWDAALSSGHAVWAIANDDTHDLSNGDRTAVSWTMVDAPTATLADVLGALRAGRSVAVVRTAKQVAPDAPMVTAVKMHDGELTVRLSGVPSKIVFIGQEGAVRKTVDDATEASYALTAADTYVRTVVRSDTLSLLLNPVVRYDGVRLPEPLAVIDLRLTWLWRFAFAAAVVAAVVLSFRRRRNM